MSHALPESPRLKAEIMFEGLRYTQALGDAAPTASPNFYPYRFAPGEPDPSGTGKASIPYLFTLDDGTLVRIKGNFHSPWHIDKDASGNHVLFHQGKPVRPVSFVPRPAWLDRVTTDGTPMARTGAEALGDMLVINVAPGCQYFIGKDESGNNMRCTFCGYGRPDERMVSLGQVIQKTELPDTTFTRMRETIAAALDTGAVKHVYLVGGSLTDWNEEGRRFLDIARAAREIVGHRAYLSLGSGALPPETLRIFKEEDLVDGVCFNLEVWSEKLFASVCPGKNRYVGWSRWLESLYEAARLFGAGNVYTAMVGGVEMEPEHGGMSPDEAIANAMAGARELLAHDVIPVWSIYWPLWGTDHPERMRELRDYFERLNAEYALVREAAHRKIDTRFMCPGCAYMQLEVDLDRFF